MPELPDVLAYISALQRMIVGKQVQGLQIRSAFLVRTFEPDVYAAVDRKVCALHRLGKRIVWELDDELCLVFHLMIAGRFHWRKAGAKPRGKNDLAAFQFDQGCLMLTEASTKRRASLHVVQGVAALQQHNPAGLEVLGCSPQQFAAVLTGCKHTLKRALTSPRIFSGIGNAYSDEILHAARLSPFKYARKLSDEELQRLYDAVQQTLGGWVARLGEEADAAFPEKVTAFRPEMAVHGKFKQPCPVCQTAIQRVVYAENEMNYCPRCQTGGKVLADRSLSRLLKDDWPRTVEELEEM